MTSYAGSPLPIGTPRLIQAFEVATRSGSDAYVSERGDVVWLSFDPQAGHEQAGRRPAVVLSPLPYNRTSTLAVFVPVTSQLKGYPFEVVIPSGLPVNGAVLADHLKSLDWRARRAERICALPVETVRQILRKAELLLGV
jgi:mRNA interferase MazF